MYKLIKLLTVLKKIICLRIIVLISFIFNFFFFVRIFGMLVLDVIKIHNKTVVIYTSLYDNNI